MRLLRFLAACLTVFVVAFALPAFAADGSLPVDAMLLPLVLGVGVAVVKLVMTLVDRSGVLAKLPAWLRPWVPLVLGALLAFLEHLQSGGDIWRAVAVAVAVFTGNQLIHGTLRGVAKARAPSPSLNLGDLGHGPGRVGR